MEGPSTQTRTRIIYLVLFSFGSSDWSHQRLTSQYLLWDPTPLYLDTWEVKDPHPCTRLPNLNEGLSGACLGLLLEWAGERMGGRSTGLYEGGLQPSHALNRCPKCLKCGVHVSSDGPMSLWTDHPVGLTISRTRLTASRMAGPRPGSLIEGPILYSEDS